MGRRIVRDGPVNQAVVAWMHGQGIKPEDVRGYTLTCNAGDPMMIDIRMYMDDVAPEPAVPEFLADGGGDVWVREAQGYRWPRGRGGPRSLDYIREHYGIAEPQPPHATCHNVTSVGDPVSAWVCGERCPREYCPDCVERCETVHDPCLTESSECAADS